MKKPVILCVDDEKVVLNCLKEQLRNRLGSDYRIECTESGEEALASMDQILENGLDLPLIISDYIMPEMRGDEFLEKAHMKSPRTITLLLTGQATLDGVTAIINRASLFRYINKPWQTEELLRGVRDGLAQYEKNKETATQTDLLQHKNTELNKWSSSFVLALGKALDKRDTTTAGHSNRMAEFAVRTADAINRRNSGPLKDVHFSESEVKSLYYSALLHDVGKIGIRENILLKQTRITEERLALMVLRLNAYRRLLTEKAKFKRLAEAEISFFEKIPGIIEFVSDINHKDFLNDEELSSIYELSLLDYEDFDGIMKPVLDETELECFSIRFGNLTDKEREIMYKHAEITYEILKDIPWPKELRSVPEIAASHHERLDGSGYYRGLRGDEISISARILAILDIYEAITSSDRPYRKKKSPEHAIEILKAEVLLGHLDGDLLDVFLDEKIYLS